MQLDKNQQKLVEMIQENPRCIEEIALDNIAKDFVEGIRKDPTQLPLTYCRSFGARGFIEFARLAFPRFQDTGLYFSIQRINREYNPENDKIKKWLIEMWHHSSPYFKEAVGNFNSYLLTCNKEEFDKFKTFPHVDLRLWAGEPTDIKSEGSHCDWSCNCNGLIQAPVVRDDDLEKLILPNLVLEKIKSHSGIFYEDKHKKYPQNLDLYYNEEMKLSRILEIK